MEKEPKIEKKCIFHAGINFNLFTSAFYVIFAFVLFFLAVSLYEGGIVFEEDFFNKNKMFNFSFISNGDFIDECKSKNSFFDIILGNYSFSKVQEINEAIHRIHGKFPLIFLG